MQFFKTIVYVVIKIMETSIKFLSNCRSASQVSYVAVRQWLEIVIDGFLKKKFGCWWVVVNDGGYILTGGGWWWIVVGGGIV